MKNVIIVTSLLLIFNGCSEKTVFVKPPCKKMSYIQQPQPRKIRIFLDDVYLYDAYIREFRGKIDNQNKLIKKFNEGCEDEKTN